MQIFENKKVLLIAPYFRHYHGKIINSIKELGADVKYFPEVINNKLFTNIRHKTFSPLNKSLDTLYFKYILSEVKENEYDIFFLVRGELINEVFLKALRKKLKSTTFIMYQWDSLIHNDYLSKIKYFDKVLTFDKKDAKNIGIEYLPLFYTDEYEKLANISSEKKYDIVFYGTYHSDRLKIIKKINQICEKNNLKFKHHLYTGKIYKFKLWIKGELSKRDLFFLKTHTVSLKEMVDVYSKSRSVLDIEMTNQTGLTIRTVEALGANKKLLTTNKEIVNSELYDKSYVYVLDRDDLHIDTEFLKMELYDRGKYKNLHINNWIKKILNT
ncbi:hypothetical protein HUE87_09275 [Candidatus Sulfurimonas marisnigri]|uniref:Lipopolysaccharide biosynthesis protein n=1 Tax=Candidatus Sulfurimonas marisnigri TaxID=2740405 RepID=A0A7S7LZ43_9BACT|nr:hypothetical protein [Candidatus Sulfurimonas marisnigri]QOY54067.1 hypothetical protein HUE87_09275 [Candidatus Sulfurimonas marisnigri]